MIQGIDFLLKVYFDASEPVELSSYSKDIFNKRVERSDVIKHLNQSLFISSPFGRFASYIKAFQAKYIEIKNQTFIDYLYKL